MFALVVKVALMVSLPLVVFLAGSRLMAKVSKQEHVLQRLSRLPDPDDRKLLNKRFGGYDAAAVARHWGALDITALGDQRWALEMDLLFPVCYGAAFLASLLFAWATLGRPFDFYWLLAPVGVTILADWTENTFQQVQLQRYTEDPASGLQPGFVQIASAATMIKLGSFSAMILLLAALLFRLLAG